jgi:hypothetical protein
MNTWVEQYLRPWTTLRQNNWAKVLPIAEYAHNSWRNNTTWKSLHQLLISINPQVDVKLINDHIPAVVDHLKALEEVRMEVQNCLEQLQQQKDIQKIMEMKVGEQIWLEGKNLQVRGSRKLLPK